MNTTNEVATNFEVVKHQEYYFCVVNTANGRYCLDMVYRDRSTANMILDFLVKPRWATDVPCFVNFNPRRHYKLATHSSSITAIIVA